ncbi:MAG: ABC transporter ATP-binding protein [Phycisphaerales bacterium]|nr:ABC transporter ATP-binding protein [Phycisphaerales bacterium]
MSLEIDITRQFRGGASISARMTLPTGGGTVTALFGPSGVGKTTILRCIAGLDTPASGRIRMNGEVWFDRATRVNQPPQARRIGYIVQEQSLFPHLTVAENIGFGVAQAAARAVIVKRLLITLGLDGLGNRRPSQLSGGQRQRVAIARALAISPAFLLMDEPLASLDTPARASLRAELRGLLASAGIPAILVTHDQSEALELADHAALMIDGSVRQVGPIAEVFSRPQDDACAAAIGVESVLSGRIERVEEGIAHVRVGSALLVALAPPEFDGIEVLVCIHASDVLLSPDGTGAMSARSRLDGRITGVVQEPSLVRVGIDCGFALTALVTRAAARELALASGQPIVASIKATNVHLIPRR